MAREHYICLACGRDFDLPARDRSYFAHAFGVAGDVADVCPHCGSGDFSAAEPCGGPGCDRLRAVGEVLCPACRRALRRRMLAFFAGLSPVELEQTERWLEGSCPTALLQEGEARDR